VEGTLYVVGSPIGNLEDITFRALRILKEVDFIAAEDTRHTQILLDRYGLKKPLISYHEHNEKTQSLRLIRLLHQGKNIALVSDAGTPTLSDPGFRLVREAVRERLRAVPIPGPSAVTACLSVSGLPTDRFVFEGFLPSKKKQRRERLRELSRERRTLILFEAPHRLRKSLLDLLEVFGDREVTMGREVTKMFEEFFHGRLKDLTDRLDREEIRGESTLLIGGLEGREELPPGELNREIKNLKRKGMRIKEIAEVLGEKYSYPKREIYQQALKSRGGN